MSNRATTRKPSLVKALKARGFDLSHAIPFESGARVGCSQCQAAAINGVACHETGCPNEVFDCKGCMAYVSRRDSYCEDCQ